MATILLVDDMIAARLALRRIIERAGHDISGDCDVSPFSNGAPLDCAVGRRARSDGCGAELIADLRREFPDIKILAVSAEDGNFPNEFQDGTMNALASPLAIAQLPRTVEEVLRRWH